MTKMLISVEEFCAIAGVGRTNANRLLRDQKVQSIKLGGRRLVVLASVEALIEQLLAEQSR